MGVHWFYGTVATLLTTLSGLLARPRLGLGGRAEGLHGILGVLAAVAVWEAVGRSSRAPIFEVHLWAVVLAYIVVRHGLRRVLSQTGQASRDQPQPAHLRRLGPGRPISITRATITASAS